MPRKFSKLFRPLRTAAVAAFLVLNVSWMVAQTGGGSISGSIHDTAGAVIPKASVTITNTETGTKRATQTSSSGEYLFPVVPVGIYNVTVTAAGFGQSEQQNVIVPLGKTVISDVTLQVGTVNSSVHVQALQSQLETQTSQAATTIDQQTFDDLPISLNGSARSISSIADLMPGVADTPATGFGATGAQGQMYSETISGGQTWSGKVLYDGIPMVSANQAGDYRQQPVPVEALQEFSLVQNNFSPEYGRTPGGALTYSTRAGTNAFHGQAYEYLRNNDLDAAGYFANHTPPLHQNEFGVNVGGPILIPHVYNGRDKLFFFAFYSGFRLAAGVPSNLITLPTIAERSGDFTGLVNSGGAEIPIYDPLTTSCDAQGNCTRQQFSYNGIPNVMDPSRIGTAGQTYVKYLPAPDNANLVNNYSTTGVNNAVQNRYGGRIDYHLHDSDEIHGFFSTGSDTVANYSTVFAQPLDTYGAGINPNNLSLVRLGEDHTFSPSVLLHLGFGYNRETEDGYPPNQHTLIDYGIANGLPTTPQMYFYPGSSNYPSTGGGGGSVVHEYAFVETGFISWTKGKHQFKIGAEYEEDGANNKSNDTIVNSLSQLETGQPNVAASGDAFASLLVGAFDKTNFSDSPFGADSRFRYAAAYVNDDYKILPNLTLNIGLRYEVPWTRHVLSDVFSTFSPDVPNPGAGGRLGALLFQGHGQYRCNCNRIASTRYIYWQPRVGFAYKLDDKTVVHGGYGLFTSVDGETVENGFAIIADGYNASPAWTSVDSGITPAVYAANGYPSFTPPPFIDPSYDNNATINYARKQGGQVGIISSYTLSVQRQLPGNFLLDVSYVGNTGQHLGALLLYPDQIPIGYIAQYGANALNAKLSSPLGQATGVPLPYPTFTGTVSQALRTYPQYQHINVINGNTGGSNYNSAQVRLQRQFRNGFSLLGSYTWGRIFSNTEASLSQFDRGPQDAFNPQAEYTHAFTEPPQTFVISYNYNLPFGIGQKYMNHGIVAAVLGGWGVSGIQHYQSGNPYFRLSSNDTLPIGNSRLRPNVVPGQPEKAHWAGKFNGRTDFYINPNGFTQPPANTFGNTSRAINLRSFGYYDEALSARKNFHIYETMNMQFRADFFNAFNRTNFGSISSAGTSNPGISASFGTLSSQGNSPRSIQFALKFLF